jgi:hypothetical protein
MPVSSPRSDRTAERHDGPDPDLGDPSLPTCLRVAPLPAPRYDQARLIGDDDRLGPVAQTQFGKDAADVGLHGLAGDGEPGGNLLVGQPGGQQAQDLGLAARELGEGGRERGVRARAQAGELADQATGDGGGQEGLARGDDTYRVEEAGR